MLAEKMKKMKNDPNKMKSWEPDMSRIQAPLSGGETSSDEEEGLSQNLHRNLLSESEFSTVYRQYNADEISVNNQHSQSLVIENGTTTSVTKNLIENGDASGPVRCQICAISLPSLSDLQMHNFVEHAANTTNTDQENAQTDKRCENT